MNIQLSDHQVEEMRAHVLDEVDADISRRGRRVRRGIAGGVGALALVTVLGVALPSITSVNSSDSLATSSLDADGGSMPVPAPTTMPDEAVRSSAGYAGNTASKDMSDSAELQAVQEPAPQPRELTAPGKDREVITTGSVSVVVKNTADSANRFTAWVEKRGGRIDGRIESRDDNNHTTATLTARIPSKHVSATIGELRTYGTVELVELQRDDVTAEGADLDARIKALRISVSRLEAILERAGSSSEVIEAESALSQRQQELDGLLAQRRSLSDQVSLSTLDVSFTQETKPGAVAPGGFWGGVIAGWNALVDTVNAVVTTAGALVPWLGVAAALGLVWWGVRRSRRNKK